MLDQTRLITKVDYLLMVGIAVSVSVASLALVARRAGTQPRGRLMVRPASVDLGQVDQRKNVPFAFTIENNTDNAYTISDVHKPCTCTAVSLPINTRIDPRSRYRVTGTLNGIGKRGAFRSTIYIDYRILGENSKSRNIELLLSVPVSVDVRPSIDVPREAIRVEPNKWKTVDLRSGTEPTFEVRRITTSDPFIKCEVDDGTLGVASNSFSVRLILDMTHLDPSLPLDGEFWVCFETSATGDPSITLPVFLTLPPS